MIKVRHPLILMQLILAFLSNDAHSQSASYSPKNFTHNISVSRIVTLSPKLTNDILVDTPRVLRINNHYYIGETIGHKVVVTDSSGYFINYIGGKGSGPGEMELVELFKVDNEGLLSVFDYGNSRVSIFNNNGAYIRSFNFVYRAMDVEYTISNDLIVCAQIRSPVSFDRPLHRIGNDGSVILSFGNSDPDINRPFSVSFFRTITPATNGGIWAAHLNKPIIERWTVSGEQKKCCY